MTAPGRSTREQVDAAALHKAAALLLAAARVDPTLRAAAEEVQDALIALDAEVHALRAELGSRGQIDVDAVERVLQHHRRRLHEHAEAHFDNGHFCTGIAWGLYAIERVARALDGVTDRAELGLNDTPRQPPPIQPREPIVALVERSSLGTPAGTAARALLSDERAAELAEQSAVLHRAVDVAAAALDERIAEFVTARVDDQFDSSPRDAARAAVEALYFAGLLAQPGHSNHSPAPTAAVTPGDRA